MATGILNCERHGEATRLTCVSCDGPVCPRCSVATGVGLKCEDCARPAATPEVALPRPGRRAGLVAALAGGIVVAVALVLATRAGSRPPPQPAVATKPVGSWEEVASLRSIRGTATAVLLSDGRVLAAGGGVGTIPLAAAELFDPASATWQTTGDLVQGRRGHQATLLDDGRVLVAGGIADGQLLATAELYDPASGQWSQSGDMKRPRLGHSLTVLPDGRVLAVGGTTLEGAEGSGGAQTVRPDGSAEIFDPSSGSWTEAATMDDARFEHTATLLADGRVLVAGGLGLDGDQLVPLQTAELYDPAAGAFLGASNLAEARGNHAAARLPDGSVLVVGGAGGPAGDSVLPSAEIFEPRHGRWVSVDSMAEPRRGATASPLEDGRVLVFGGETASAGARRSLVTAEIFDRSAGRWTPATRAVCPRSEQAAVTLGDGTVLVVAGDATFPGQAPVAQSCTERFRP